MIDVHPPSRTSGRPRGDIFLTGATGFLGTALLARLAADEPDRRVWALVRARSDAEARTRLVAALAQAAPACRDRGERIVAIAGDLTEPGLGLDPDRRDELAARVSHVIHSAASVSFTLALDQARAINVDGTRRVLELAERCPRLECISHVSTAYVAGTHRGSFTEDDHDLGQGFNNAYERSKWEAERLVHAAAGRLPVQVLRPSIVVGDERDGWTSSFNVIYSPLEAFARGALPALPARRAAPVDVVPVSYVADALLALATGAPARTYHLSAGAATSTVGELVGLGARRFGQRQPMMVPPRLYRHLVHPLLLWRSSGARRRWLERSQVFFPYFAAAVTFDTRHARAALAPHGIEPPPPAAYFDRLIDYAERADWGRRRPDGAADPAAVKGPPATV